jgi:hypothetical protein
MQLGIDIANQCGNFELELVFEGDSKKMVVEFNSLLDHGWGTNSYFNIYEPCSTN